MHLKRDPIKGLQLILKLEIGMKLFMEHPPKRPVYRAANVIDRCSTCRVEPSPPWRTAISQNTIKEFVFMNEAVDFFLFSTFDTNALLF